MDYDLSRFRVRFLGENPGAWLRNYRILGDCINVISNKYSIFDLQWQILHCPRCTAQMALQHTQKVGTL